MSSNNNGNISSKITNFPQGSYRSYKSFLNQYKKEPAKTTEVQRITMPISNKQQPKQQLPVSRIEMTNANLSNQLQKRSCSVLKQEPNNNINNNQLNDIFNLEKLLAMSSNEIELLDKNVLEKFLKLLIDEQKKYNSENGTDLNNNTLINQTKITYQNGDDNKLTDDDIDKCKMNLIQSLKQQLEQYRQQHSQQI